MISITISGAIEAQAGIFQTSRATAGGQQGCCITADVPLRAFIKKQQDLHVLCI
jgi:hypothetical protein